jgi:hypothetical protein
MSHSSHPSPSSSRESKDTTTPPKEDQTTPMQPSNVEVEGSSRSNNDAPQQSSGKESMQSTDEDANDNPDRRDWLDNYFEQSGINELKEEIIRFMKHGRQAGSVHTGRRSVLLHLLKYWG